MITSLKEKTVLARVIMYEEFEEIGCDIEYSEFESGNDLFENPTAGLSWFVEGVSVEQYNQTYWLEALVEGIEVFLTKDHLFADASKLVIDIIQLPSDILPELPLYQVDNIEVFLKKRIKDKRIQNLEISFFG